MKWNLMENAISFADRLKLASFVLSTNRFTNGERVKKLEKEWSNWLGCNHSLFVSSGSTANFLLIAAIKELYNLKAGDKVLVPACTWMTNVAPIIQLGLKPIFCDIQFSDFSFNEKELEYVAKKHPNIKLIFVTHLLGFTSKSRVNGNLKKYFPEALVIDDVCESHGCEYYNEQGELVKVGSDSLGATFSTYFGHHLTSIEGGFVSTNNPELYDLMKMKRSHGMARESVVFDKYASEYTNIDKSFLFITDGYNFRNTEIGAVLGSSQLKRLDKSIEIRKFNFLNFVDIVNGYNLFEPVSYDLTNSSFCFPFVCKDHETFIKLKEAFRRENIEYRPIVSGNLLNQPFLKKYSICSSVPMGKTNVEQLHKNGLYIGNSQFINKHHLNKLIDILESL